MPDRGDRQKPGRLAVLVMAMLLLLAGAILLRVERQLSLDSAEHRGQRHWRTWRGQRGHLPPPQVAVDAPIPEEDPVAGLAQELASGLIRRETLPFSDRNFCVAVLNQTTNSFSQKRQAALALAADQSDAAFALILGVLANAPSGSRAAMAEALGTSKRLETASLLASLLNDSDESVARGAVRGVAASDPGSALNTLKVVLAQEDRPVSVRTEAALCLGGLEDASATEALKAAALDVKNTTVARHVLVALGSRPFKETESFYQEYLSAGMAPDELRVGALESLSASDGSAGWFLLRAAAQEADPKARAAAAWALSNAEDQGSFGVDLVGLLRTEGDPDVRRRLYQALRNQDNCDAKAVVRLLGQEPEPTVRLAAFDALASAMRSTGTPDTAAFFNDVATTELLRAALSGNSDSSAMQAVVILRKARTPASMAALQQIAGSSENLKVAGAARSAVEATARMRRP